MKKLILLIITMLLTSVLFAQVKKSNYEKYWEAKEAAKFGDTIKTTTKVVEKPEYDDLYYIAEKNDNQKKFQIEINNYYSFDDYQYTNLINRYHRGSFTLWFVFHYSPFYYNSWYWEYDPWYYDWYYPYYSWNYYWYRPYYGWNWYYRWNYPYYLWNYGYWNYPRYYIHNTYDYFGMNRPKYNSIQYSHRERPSTTQLTQSKARRITVAQNQAQTRTVTTTQKRRTVTTNPQNKPAYSEGRRTYTPSYENPHMSTRPNYNNTTPNRIHIRSSTTTQTHTQMQTRTTTSSNQNRPIYSHPSTNSERPSYLAPSTSSSRNSNSYSHPSLSTPQPYNRSSSGGRR